MRLGAFLAAMILVLAALGCASETRSTSRAANEPTARSSSPALGSMTYDEAVRQIRRPPTSARSLPNGDLVATWVTEVPGGEKHLILTFGPDRVLKDHREEVR